MNQELQGDDDSISSDYDGHSSETNLISKLCLINVALHFILIYAFLDQSDVDSDVAKVEKIKSDSIAESSISVLSEVNSYPE